MTNYKTYHLGVAKYYQNKVKNLFLAKTHLGDGKLTVLLKGKVINALKYFIHWDHFSDNCCSC